MTSIPGREHGTHRDGISVCWASVTKHHGLGVFKNRHLFLQSSGGLKSKVKVLVVLVFPGAPLLGFRMAAFSVSSDGLFSVRGHP